MYIQVLNTFYYFYYFYLFFIFLKLFLFIYFYFYYFYYFQLLTFDDVCHVLGLTSQEMLKVCD